MYLISDKFKNLVEYKSGYTWSKDQESTISIDGSVRVLTVTNIQEKLDLRSELYLTQVSEKDKDRKAASKGWSIAVSSNGNRKRIGNAVFIEDDTDYLFASFLTGFIPKDSNVILPEYFFYWMSSQPVQERITSVSEGTTGLGNLDIRFLRNMDIKFPQEILAQKAIAGILSKVYRAIEAVENSIKAAERLKKSLMQNLLTGKLKPDGKWRNEHEFYHDEKLGRVPIGWDVRKVKEVIKLKNGKGNTTSNLKDIPDAKYNVPVYGGNGITGYYHTPLLTEETLIVGRVGEYCGNVFKTPKESWVTDNAMLVDQFLLEDFNIDFLEIKLNSLNFKHYSDSTGQPKITQSGIGALRFILPVNVAEQNDIAEFMTSAITNISKKHLKIQALENFKKSLMQNLLIGKVRVDVPKINKLLGEN
jgi:type I restriction enzyme, S subunit